MWALILAIQENDTIRDTVLYDENEERSFAYVQALTTLVNLGIFNIYLNPSNSCCNIGIPLSGCEMGQINPTFDCSSGTGGDCSSGSSGDCSSGSSGGCSSGSSGDCSSGGSSGDCSSGGSSSSSCASPYPAPFPKKDLKVSDFKTSQYYSKEPIPPQVLLCAALSPLACYVFMKVTKYPIRKPITISSITGTVDGLVWSSLISASYYIYTKDDDPRMLYMFLIFGMSAGNLAGSLAGSYGGSEGAYVLKTISTVYFPYLYFQLKRVILGRAFGDDKETRLDLTFSTFLSIGGALGTFALNFDKDITLSEALGIGIGAFFGSILSEGVAKATNVESERLKGFINVSGSLLFAYLTYKSNPKKPVKTLF